LHTHRQTDRYENIFGKGDYWRVVVHR